MRNREQGFTLIEILIVITIIAALVGLVAALIPKGIKAKEKTTCLKNLSELGGLLITRRAGKGWNTRLNGAAFLLQVADEIQDENLRVFICPGEPKSVAPDRPEVGSQEFIEMYRSMNLKEGVRAEYTSYAGPNWKDYPPARAGRAALESRVIACDRCADGQAYHDGICVVYDSSSTRFIDSKEIAGFDPDVGAIIVGKNSKDKRLKKMIFFPED